MSVWTRFFCVIGISVGSMLLWLDLPYLSVMFGLTASLLLISQQLADIADKIGRK